MSLGDPRRRARPKPRRLRLGSVLVLLAVVVLLGVVFTTARNTLSTRLAPASAASRPTPPAGTIVPMTVTPGQSVAEIARDLRDLGLVPSDALFIGFVRLRGGGTDIQPGLHQIVAGWSMEQILANLEQPVGPREIRLTLPEGRRLEEHAELAVSAGVGTLATFSELAAKPQPEWTYAFLADKPREAGLEGYLFPDTYQLPGASPAARDLITRMLETFDKRVTPDLRQTVAGNKRSLYDTLTIASIVEREARAPAERPLIAGVYWNRLKQGMGLFADPTVQYALGQPGSWWPQLSLDDLKVSSAYNTYVRQGLPPGPICSPGLASIQAAVQPQGDFLYFVAKGDGSGEHAFARSLAEHNANRARFRQ